LDFYEQGDVRR